MGKFQIGNRFWELAPTSGRKPLYNNPKELENDILEYFKVTSERTDWNKQQWVGKEGNEVVVNVPTPFTLSGLYLFLGICQQTWANYKAKSEFLGIITWAESVIYTQKFEGAATNHFNANIIARDLGLADKQDLNHGGQDDGNSIKVEIMRPISD